MQSNLWRSAAWVAVGVVGASVLGLFGGADAAPQGGQPPFRNAVEQREEMIHELREIKLLLKEQNALLRTLAPQGQGHAPLKH